MSTPIVESEQIFAQGNQPDSITIGGGSIWVEYGDGAPSAGGGTSTIVQYSMTGVQEHIYRRWSGRRPEI
jgi:hypothetical protein